MVPGAPARLCSPVTMQAVERMGACKTSAERVALRADLCIYACALNMQCTNGDTTVSTRLLLLLQTA